MKIGVGSLCRHRNQSLLIVLTVRPLQLHWIAMISRQCRGANPCIGTVRHMTLNSKKIGEKSSLNSVGHSNLVTEVNSEEEQGFNLVDEMIELGPLLICLRTAFLGLMETYRVSHLQHQTPHSESYRNNSLAPQRVRLTSSLKKMRTTCFSQSDRKAHLLWSSKAQEKHFNGWLKSYNLRTSSMKA